MEIITNIPLQPEENEMIIKKATVKKSQIEKLAAELSVATENLLSIRFLLGKNALNNWKIYKASSQTDTVFHLNKFSSAYVIVNVPMDELTKEQIYFAANLCKSKSKYKQVPKVGVLYTPISNTILGEQTGSFLIKNNHKAMVAII